MIKCIIVDDEQPARELIAFHLSGLEDVLLIGMFANATDAFSFLQKNEVDLMFLDIQMPKLSGLELIKSLRRCPKIILTTAFREYAVEAFELDVLDYLVKPITQERFIKALSKFTYYTASMNGKESNAGDFEEAYIFLKVNRDQVKVFLKDILYIEGLKDYIKVHTLEKVMVVYERLGYMEEKLPEHKFTRIHKSFIVAVDKITHYNSEQVSIDDKPLPIGRLYKKIFFTKLPGK